MQDEKTTTLFDRFAVGLVSGLSAFFTLGAFVLLFGIMAEGDTWIIACKILYAAVVVFFIVGFTTLDNYFILILSPLWKILGKLLSSP